MCRHCSFESALDIFNAVVKRRMKFNISMEFPTMHRIIVRRKISVNKFYQFNHCYGKKYIA